MRISAIRTLANVALVAVVAAGCTATDNNDPDCANQPQAPSCAPAAPTTPPDDLVVNEVSIRAAAEATRDALGATYDIEFVRGSEKLPCGKSVVVGNETQTVFFCGPQNYLAVPDKIQTIWKDLKAATIWYLVARIGVLSQVANYETPAKNDCAAAHIATLSPHFSEAQAAALRTYVHDKDGTEPHFLDAGFNAARENLPVAVCSAGDVTVLGVSARKVLETTRGALNGDYTVIAVKGNMKVRCGKGNDFVVTAQTESPVFCSSGRFMAITEEPAQKWKDLDASWAWYVLASAAAKANRSYDSLRQSSCVGGYMAAQQPGFASTTSNQLLDNVLTIQGNDEVQGATKGARDYANGKRIVECTTA